MKTEVIEVHPEYPDIKKIAHCARIIRQGGLVIFPTDTVYGIAADYTNPRAIERLREVKKRSEGKPFAVLIAQMGLISNYTSSTDPALYKLISQYWPGPLTVVVPSREDGKTIGIRMPDHAVALKLIQESQCAVAAPSANFEGEKEPTTCQEALKSLDGLVDVALDSGASKIGKGSSVVDVTRRPPVLLREGIIKEEDIKRVVNRKTILFVCTGNSCRSVMAEYLLKKALSGRSDMEVSSAGTGVFIQSRASDETIAVLREENIDASRHISRSVSAVLLKKADLILVMTRSHRQQVLERAPEVEKRVYLLKEFSPNANFISSDMDVPDPIGRSRQGYVECLAMIKESINKIVNLI